MKESGAFSNVDRILGPELPGVTALPPGAVQALGPGAGAQTLQNEQQANLRGLPAAGVQPQLPPAALAV